MMLTHDVEEGRGLVFVLSDDDPRSGGDAAHQLAVIAGREGVAQRVDDRHQTVVDGRRARRRLFDPFADLPLT